MVLPSFFSNYVAVEAASKNIDFLRKKIDRTGARNCKILHYACYSKNDEILEIQSLQEANQSLGQCVDGLIDEVDRIQAVNEEILRTAEAMAKISKNMD